MLHYTLENGGAITRADRCRERTLFNYLCANVWHLRRSAGETFLSSKGGSLRFSATFHVVFGPFFAFLVPFSHLIELSQMGLQRCNVNIFPPISGLNFGR